MAEDRKTYTLKKPILHGEQMLTELNIREPKAKDFRAFPVSGQTVGDILNVMGKLCGQPTVVMDELCAEDVAEVASLFGGFMSAGQPTGSTP